jgi:FkbM family methyltransferase
LSQNLAATGYPGVAAVNQAVWDDAVTLTFCHQTDAPGGSHVGPGQGETCSVPGGKLDDLVDAAGLTRVDVIKMDVEGAESKALLGAARTLREKRPALIMEINPLPLLGVSGVTPADLYHQVRSYGYSVHVFSEAGLVPAPDYGVLEGFWRRGSVLVDVLCE